MICVGVLGRTSIPKLINILVFACLLCVPPLNSWQKKRVKSDVQVIPEQSLIQDMYFAQKKRGLASPCISINTQRLGIRMSSLSDHMLRVRLNIQCA